ncbi:MAG TPA: LLM class F420-dependent oxidoreductase [Roseiflexaceae bacterium]
MKLDAALAIDAAHLRDVARIARAAEAVGFGALWTPETQHNGFYPLLVAAEHTERIELGTAVAIAFPRSPMVMAQNAWDLQALSGGRFILGLGTQVKAHIERRFSVAWDSPVARLRDYIAALRAIWRAWQTGEKLAYQGEFYQHTLMTPFFNPGPIAHPRIPIYIAGVNEGLARLAGEVCDGFHVHPFHSVKYLNEVVRPQIAAGAERAGRSLADVTLVSSVFAITGANEAAIDATRTMAREQIAFYASTPTYRVVLECHGWQDIGEQLSRLAAMKRWSQMSALITDEMLEVFAVQAPLDRIGQAIRARYEGVLDRVFGYLPYVPGELDDAWRAIAAAVQSGA